MHAQNSRVHMHVKKEDAKYPNLLSFLTQRRSVLEGRKGKCHEMKEGGREQRGRDVSQKKESRVT